MLVVVRYRNGRVVRGRTTDFRPDATSFHIHAEGEDAPEHLPIAGIKAVFFVRSLGGDPRHQDHREFPAKAGVRSKLWIEFMDGEVMAAWPVSAFLGDRGFYVLPTDQSSNLEKVYVFRDAVKQILQDRDAELAATVESRRRRTETIVQLVGRGRP